MEINQLKAFVTVARLSNLTRAAEALCLTQPAVTAQIKALEQSLGLALFERSSRKMAITKAGEQLLPTAEQLLSLATQIKTTATELQGELSGQLRLGIPGEHLDFLRLGELVQRIHHGLPLIELETMIMPADTLSEHVATGQLQAAFIISPHPPLDVFWLPIRSVSFRVAVPVTLYPQLKLGGWQELAQLPWLDGPLGSHIHYLLRDLFERRGLTPRVIMHNDSMAHFDTLVRAGAGCALIREEIALQGAQKNHFAIWGHAKADALLGFISANENAQTPLIMALVSMLKDIWSLDSTINSI
ncbi:MULTISPECIES: LysR family transcriptional regulator [Paenalcaligenes]|uniref:LysR family transcriptional regulator n=1 Tax=Paenalcaligenes hermetiae TaxID=1157987 RepID=A0ABP9LZX8_9BURK|nr:LysR family transcriptional regulator [Paenalcaligenes sp.]